MSTSPPTSTGAETPTERPVESELAQFFGYSHDVLTIMDDEGRVRLISPSVERVLGYPIGEVFGRRFLWWVHPEDRPVVKDQARTLSSGQSVADVDARVLHAQGGWVPMRWSLAVGPNQRVYAVGRDRTVEMRHRKTQLRHEMAELRLRTTLELHDGILQMLTGASLQIKAALSLLETDPEAVEAVLHTLAESISGEQREMRLYVDEVKGRSPAWTDANLALSKRIETIIDRVGMVWELDTSVEANVSSDVPAELGRQILRIVQEATVNAVRHGGAKSVSVAVSQEGDEVTITVTDDGTGFSFLGEYDHEALMENRLGPLSLKHRVEEAGGRIHITSTPSGSILVVELTVVREPEE